MEEDIIGAILNSWRWEEFSSDPGQQKLFVRSLKERLSDEISMQVHEWYLEEMDGVFGVKETQPLIRRLGGIRNTFGNQGL